MFWHTLVEAMVFVLSKYIASFKIGIGHSLEYRFDFFVLILSTLFPIIVQVFLWYAVFGGSSDDVMYGFTLQQMLAYVAIAGAVGKFVTTGIEETVNNDIHSGKLASFLIKPLNYIQFRMLQVFGQKLTPSVTLLVFTGAVLGVLWFLTGHETELYSILFFIAALLLGLLLNFYIFILISITAFWLTEVGRLFHAVNVILLVLSGGVFPISIFGETYVYISQYLPFQYTMYFPISVLTGSVTVFESCVGLLIQAMWIAVLCLSTKLLWNIGLNKFVAVGG